MARRRATHPSIAHASEEITVKGPGGLAASARGMQGVTVLVLALAAGAVVYFTNTRIDALSKEHHAMTTEMSIATCVNTLTQGERQALRFNKQTPWKSWCWWMKED